MQAVATRRVLKNEKTGRVYNLMYFSCKRLSLMKVTAGKGYSIIIAKSAIIALIEKIHKDEN